MPNFSELNDKIYATQLRNCYSVVLYTCVFNCICSTPMTFLYWVERILFYNIIFPVSSVCMALLALRATLVVLPFTSFLRTPFLLALVNLVLYLLGTVGREFVGLDDDMQDKLLGYTLPGLFALQMLVMIAFSLHVRRKCIQLLTARLDGQRWAQSSGQTQIHSADHLRPATRTSYETLPKYEHTVQDLHAAGSVTSSSV
jgi:hypothetical protein